MPKSIYNCIFFFFRTINLFTFPKFLVVALTLNNATFLFGLGDIKCRYAYIVLFLDIGLNFIMCSNSTCRFKTFNI